MFRTLALVLTVLALACFAATPALAQKDKAETAEGTFVKVDGKTLTVKDFSVTVWAVEPARKE